MRVPFLGSVVDFVAQRFEDNLVYKAPPHYVRYRPGWEPTPGWESEVRVRFLPPSTRGNGNWFRMKDEHEWWSSVIVGTQFVTTSQVQITSYPSKTISIYTGGS